MFRWTERFWLGLTLAGRNLLRHKRRTLQTLFVLVIGLTSATLLDGFITFQLNGLEHIIVRSGTGSLQAEVSRQAYNEADRDPFPYLIPHSAKLVHDLRRSFAVDDALEAFPFESVASVGDKTLTLRILALPTRQAQQLLSARQLVAGKDLPQQPSGEILLGEGAARLLGLHPGDQVLIYAMTAGGGVNEDTFVVSGLETSGIAAADASSAFMDLADAQKLIGTTDVPQLIVFLNRNSQAAQFQKKWTAHFPGSGAPHLVWKRWDQLSPYWQQASGSLLMVLGVARFIVLLIAIFSVAGAVTLSVLERLRETGTVRAFGVPRRAVVAQFLAEGLLLGLVGSFVGTLIGLGSCQVLNWLGGVSVTAPGMAQPIAVLFTPNSHHFAQNLILITVAAGLGTLFSAFWTTRVTITRLLNAF